MNKQQAHKFLHDQFRTFILKQNEDEKNIFWSELNQQYQTISESDKNLLYQTMLTDVQAIKKRVIEIKEKVLHQEQV